MLKNLRLCRKNVYIIRKKLNFVSAVNFTDLSSSGQHMLEMLISGTKLSQKYLLTCQINY